jgi:hypothetical protein
MELTMNWNPFTLAELEKVLEDDSNWFLDGGHSLDVYLGRTTRAHADTDIGVFSTDVELLLSQLIQRGYDVYIANKKLTRYLENKFDSTDYNYWIADSTGYRLQILVYTLENDRVLFRRSKRISWPEKDFVLLAGPWRLANPLVTYAFKVTNIDPLQKDMQDIDTLFKVIGSHVT